MLSYDLYGLGNALIDSEAKVTEADIEAWGLRKGGMQLIDEQQLAAFQSSLGDSLEQPACGGSAANTIITAQGLGLNTAYACQVGTDDWGKFYTEDLTANGVSAHVTQESGKTGHCMVLITGDAQRTMATYLGVTAHLGESCIDEAGIRQSRCLYIEGYLMSSDTARAAVKKAVQVARAAGVKIAFTMSDPFIAGGFKDYFKDVLGNRIDVLFCNEGEALAYTGLDCVESSIDPLRQWADLVLVTLGEKGAIAADPNAQVRVAAKPVQALDSTGAGDAFAAGFLFAHLKGRDLQRAAEFGCRLGSDVVAQYGPRIVFTRQG